eukprot:15342074-Ditylum_brightwellii.AAC.1
MACHRLASLQTNYSPNVWQPKDINHVATHWAFGHMNRDQYGSPLLLMILESNMWARSMHTTYSKRYAIGMKWPKIGQERDIVES